MARMLRVLSSPASRGNQSALGSEGARLTPVDGCSIAEEDDSDLETPTMFGRRRTTGSITACMLARHEDQLRSFGVWSGDAGGGWLLQGGGQDVAASHIPQLGVLAKLGLCMVLVVVNANDLIMKSYSLQRRDPSKGPAYIPQSVTFLSDVIGVVVVNIWLMIYPGSSGYKSESGEVDRGQAFRFFYNRERILNMATPAIFFTVSGVVKFVALGMIPSEVVATVGQIHMIMCAVAGKCVLGKTYSRLQWGALVLVTAALARHSHTGAGNSSAAHGDAGQSKHTLGVCLVLLSTLLATMGGLVCETLVKQRTGAPYWMQKAQMELAGAGACLVYSFIIEPVIMGTCPLLERGLLSGWDMWTVAALGVNLCKSWLAGIFVMLLDNLTFSVAGAASMLLVYAEKLLLEDDPRAAFDMDVFLGVMTVTLAVCSFVGATWLNNQSKVPPAAKVQRNSLKQLLVARK